MIKSQNKSFILYQEYKNNISILNQSQKGDLLDAIFSFNEGIEIELEPIVKMAFSFIKSDLERNKIKYQNIIDRNRINGCNGGRPKKQKNPVGYLETQINPNKPKETLYDNVNEDDNDNLNKNINKKNIKKEIQESNFEEFWRLYDNKKAKPKAMASYQKALKSATHEQIIEGVKKYVSFRGADSQYWKHPTTWLNSQGWLDEYKQKGYNSNIQFAPKYTQDKTPEVLTKEEEVRRMETEKTILKQYFFYENYKSSNLDTLIEKEQEQIRKYDKNKLANYFDNIDKSIKKYTSLDQLDAENRLGSGCYYLIQQVLKIDATADNYLQCLEKLIIEINKEFDIYFYEKITIKKIN